MRPRLDGLGFFFAGRPAQPNDGFRLTILPPLAKTGDMIHRLLPYLSALRPTRLGVLFAVLVGLGVGFWQWLQPPRPRVVLQNLGRDIKAVFSPDSRALAIIEGDRFNQS